MVLQCKGLSSNFRQIVNETDHGLSALRVKLIIVTCLNLSPLLNTLFLCLLKWISRYGILNIVP